MSKTDVLRLLPSRASLACIAGLLLTACGGQVDLLSQVSESQANDVLAALISNGIAAEKIAGKEGKVSVRVAGDGVAKAIEIMHAEGLPRVAHATLGEVFKKEGLISSPTEEKARMIFALSQELAGTLTKIDGVIDAQVHVVLPERGGFGESGSAATAAVFIKHQDTVDLGPVLPQIRRLVANSIPDLAYEKVSVVQVPAAPRAAGPASPGQLASVWGIKVSETSAGPLRVLLATLILLVLAAASGTGYFFWRSRGATAKSDATE